MVSEVEIKGFQLPDFPIRNPFLLTIFKLHQKVKMSSILLLGTFKMMSNDSRRTPLHPFPQPQLGLNAEDIERSSEKKHPAEHSCSFSS
jgi:hypothetical protein